MKENKTILLNDVKNRFLPIPQSALEGLEPEPKITDFDVIREIGMGSFGRVYLVIHKKTKVKYAIKAIDKKNKENIEDKPYFRRELEVMYKIHHPNVVKLFGHFEDKKYCYFIMEYISKGNLFDLIHLDKTKILSHKIIASILKDIVSAVFFLHNMNPPIIHRDIKPENVLINSNLEAKLTDFGWSNYIQEKKERMTVCGTPIYLAPEIIKEKGHDERVDIWCLGVLLFELTTGEVPFPGKDLEALKNDICHLNINWPKNMDSDVKDLISKILKLDPEERIPLEEIIEHPFILKYFPEAPTCLILPDPNISYKTFVVSKDDPRTWDPVKININFDPLDIPKEENENEEEPIKETKDKYSILQSKYESLKTEYYSLKSGNEALNEVEELKRKIREKNEKLEQLSNNDNKNEDIEENELKNRCSILENENSDLRNKVLAFENKIKEEQNYSLDAKLEEIKKSLTNYNGEYDVPFEELKKHFNKEKRKSLHELIIDKDKEIEKYKEEERVKREKTKKDFANLINKYDKTLDWVEKQNDELKRKINELESRLAQK